LTAAACCPPKGVTAGGRTNEGKLVFAELAAHLPLTTLRRCVARNDGEHNVQRLSCLDY